MIRTAQDVRRALFLGHDGGGMVPAYVVERAQFLIATAHNDERFSGKIASDVLAGLLQLVRSRYHLPRPAKHVHALELGDPRIYVPRSRNRGSLFQRSFGSL